MKNQEHWDKAAQGLLPTIIQTPATLGILSVQPLITDSLGDNPGLTVASNAYLGIGSFITTRSLNFP